MPLWWGAGLGWSEWGPCNMGLGGLDAACFRRALFSQVSQRTSQPLTIPGAPASQACSADGAPVPTQVISPPSPEGAPHSRAAHTACSAGCRDPQPSLSSHLAHSYPGDGCHQGALDQALLSRLCLQDQASFQLDLLRLCAVVAGNHTHIYQNWGTR